MKKSYLTIVLAVMSVGNMCAQEQPKSTIENPNALKLNVISLATGKVSAEYERFLTNRISAGIAVTLKGKSGIPFKSSVTDLLEDEDQLVSLISGFKSSTTSFTPEVRFYTSGRGVGRGFYVAPYVKYAKFDFTAPYQFDVEIDAAGQTVYDRKEEIPLKGDLTSVTAGLSLGVNFKLAKKVYLDWRFFGPGYGTAKGGFAGQMALNSDEQDGLKEGLSELKTNLEDLPVKIKMDYTVNGEGADITINKSPWANIRSGLSIAYRF